ncbi:putative N6-adenine-specific DNA methylase [Dysgonomonas sp. PFB1-18]|nr:MULTISPECIES: THUMP domain-containing protein [unclassified Dysgonomonas]MDH6308423.1 putative N6-adenine-specific DNA methylase [Dysgonomonas sp. PF1-14]MDH6337924.1 putative N6-adenine-specific DNA methylase [Dysgonomonas sp. PF1-16]MDH6379421.1 putative N6-adenine-specific DNA methylase [Dysgonomonas sp. PFB1-18]MDH6396752.1 putative N6-adenine-specific DNA methylase [Dysgonomonas sp. PF1-23]
MNSRNFAMIAKTMAGLEDVLAEELISLGANNLEIGTRMVAFEGDLALLYKANIHCRTALRILRPVYEFKAKNADEIYKKVKAMNWFEHLSEDSTFAIDAVTFSDYFTHSKFVAYRVKDAIADYFMQKTGKRPSVDVKNPDLLINFHIAHDKCTLSFDSSGESLHKRGYRVAQTEAPLNEVLAAGMILKTGWRGESDFIDPMCGSGTLLIEAAMIAMNVPPGIYRQNFAFEKWKNFNRDLFETIYNDDSGEREFKHKIYGSDILPEAIDIASKNIKSAGVEKYIELKVMPFENYTEAPAEKGIFVTNPPYGERIKPEDLSGLYEKIGERLKHVFMGYSAWILSYKKECFDKIGLKPSKKIQLVNGSLQCEFRRYDIFAGKRNERQKK